MKLKPSAEDLADGKEVCGNSILTSYYYRPLYCL